MRRKRVVVKGGTRSHYVETFANLLTSNATALCHFALSPRNLGGDVCDPCAGSNGPDLRALALWCFALAICRASPGDPDELRADVFQVGLKAISLPENIAIRPSANFEVRTT